MATNENILLYAESKITRKQAINEIANVILRSNMKPEMVQYALELLQKLLPSNNTLPNDIDELFSAMMSSENDWRLAQYLMRHKQCLSSLSNSDDENELTHYDRLQQCLRPITDLSRDFDLNYATSLHNNNILSSDQRSQSTSDSVNPSSFFQSFRQLINETSSTTSTHESNFSETRRILKQFEDNTDDETLDNNNKLCCFEMNGYDLLNGGKRYRYD